jgi:hypothetical protein
MCVCSICGAPYEPTRWRFDWCAPCTELNFASSIDVRLHDELAPAREALEAAVSVPLTTRQRSHLQRLHAHWEAEARRRVAEGS